MYFNANVKPVSLRSTMRTLPKAPLPTTRSRRKWLRLTGRGQQDWRWERLRGFIPSSVKTTGFPLELPIETALARESSASGCVLHQRRARALGCVVVVAA